MSSSSHLRKDLCSEVNPGKFQDSTPGTRKGSSSFRGSNSGLASQEFEKKRIFSGVRWRVLEKNLPVFCALTGSNFSKKTNLAQSLSENPGVLVGGTFSDVSLAWQVCVYFTRIHTIRFLFVVRNALLQRPPFLQASKIKKKSDAHSPASASGILLSTISANQEAPTGMMPSLKSYFGLCTMQDDGPPAPPRNT